MIRQDIVKFRRGPNLPVQTLQTSSGLPRLRLLLSPVESWGYTSLFLLFTFYLSQ
jgi:hypothetical protein